MSELKPCEAIEILESIYPSKKQIVTGEYPKVAEALDMAIAALRHAEQEHKGSKCTWPDGVEVKIGGIPVAPCIYTDRQRLHDVDITISECEKCGAIDISWSKNEDTEVIYEDADFVKRSRNE